MVGRRRLAALRSFLFLPMTKHKERCASCDKTIDTHRAFVRGEGRPTALYHVPCYAIEFGREALRIPEGHGLRMAPYT